MPTNRYGIYYPTSSSESEGEDEPCYVPEPVERPTTSTSHYTLNTFNSAPSSTQNESTTPPPTKSPPKSPQMQNYSMPQQQAPRIITTTAVAPPSSRPYHSDSDSDDEEIHRLKVQSPIDEVAELALDDIDIKEDTTPSPAPSYKGIMKRAMSSASTNQPTGASKSGFDVEEISRKRVEKDLCELQQLINYHFEERKKEEKELNDLKDRIEKRKEYRAAQIIVRQQREAERRERVKTEKLAKEKLEREKAEEEERRRKEQLAAMSMNFTYADRAKDRKGRRGTARDAKRKALAERRKPLNIDHLNRDKLIEKAKEIYSWLVHLETERVSYEHKVNDQKYELGTLRHRVNDLINKSGKSKQPRVGKLKIPAK